MYAGGEGLHCQDTGLKLVFAQDDDGAGGLVGGFKGFFQPEAAVAQLDAQPAWRSSRARARAAAFRPSPSGAIKASAFCGSWAGFLGEQREHQPVLAHGKADAGGFGPADGFAQAVVAAAAEQGVLRAQAAVRELEGGAGVVVEAAHQAVIARVGHAGGIERGGDGGEVGLGVFVERVGDLGQRVDDGLVFRNFAVEHAEGVGDGAALAVCAHLGDDGDEGGAKSSL